jgi:hypothetical protein
MPNFMKSDAVRSILYLRPKVNLCPCFHIYFPTWVHLQFRIRDMYIMPLTICDFRENRHRDGHTFIAGLSVRYMLNFTCLITVLMCHYN